MSLISSGPITSLPGKVIDAKTVEALGQPFQVSVPVGAREGEPVSLSVRPEKVGLNALEPEGTVNCLRGKVTFVRDLGSIIETYVSVQERQIIVVGAPRHPAGTPVWLTFPPEECVVLSA